MGVAVDDLPTARRPTDIMRDKPSPSDRTLASRTTSVGYADGAAPRRHQHRRHQRCSSTGGALSELVLRLSDFLCIASDAQEAREDSPLPSGVELAAVRSGDVPQARGPGRRRRRWCPCRWRPPRAGAARRGARRGTAAAPLAPASRGRGGARSLGPVARYLGILAATTSNWEAAAGHFEDAITMNARMGARPWLAHTRDDYARMLRARDQPGDQARALELRDEAVTAYRELGMESWANAAAAL